MKRQIPNILCKHYLPHIKCRNQFEIFFKNIANRCMCHGKKSQAYKTVWLMLDILQHKIQTELPLKKGLHALQPEKNSIEKQKGQEPLNWILWRVIQSALQNISPTLEVRKVRVAGSTVNVPAALSKKKRDTQALNWIIESAQKKQKNSKGNFSQCLAEEFIDAFRKQGAARQKREELHRLAQTNRAYIRYRWW